MRVLRDIHNLPKFENAVVTIGSFDGVHNGHRALIKKVKSLAQKVEGEVVIITFHPHPRQIIYPKDDSLKLLNSIEEKIQLFEKLGVENLVIVPFSIEFSQQPADEYVEKFLVEKFRPKIVVVGFDHKFGLNRQGDINYLKHHGKNHGFEVKEIQKQMLADLKISSTRIREALSKQKIKEANQNLGYHYMLTGEVIRGLELGSKLGFPTANLKVSTKYKLVPPNGVYAAYVWYKNQRYKSMFYIGNRMTLEGHPQITMETNIFDFDDSIYGEIIQVELVDFIRDGKKFDDLNALKAQLQKDKISSQKVLEDFEKTQKLEAQKKSVGVVILNYNGKEHLKNFLPSVLKTTYSKTKIWVADNASTDDSVAFLKNEYPSIELLQLTDNQGYAGGYNESLALIEGEVDYYVLLNSDVEVTPNWLEPIVDLMSADKGIVACQPKILSYHKKTHFEYAGAAGGWMDSLGYPFCKGRIFDELEVDKNQYDEPSEIFWASGACMVIRADKFHALGGLDNSYFAHMEEIDLCWRMKNAGYKIMSCPQSIVYHLGGGTLDYESPRKTFLNFRNSLATLLKNQRKRKLLWLIPLRLLLDGLAGVKFLFDGKWRNTLAIIKAHFGFYGMIPNLLDKRLKNRKRINANVFGSKYNSAGVYEGSVVWDFYLRKKRTFSEVVFEPQKEHKRK